ncbi:5-oxoprolinase subunit PxpB [Pseudobacillus badius]|uniref:5-oxoprolinase subunit PxpB n=1 Tax=Bacillus badius TaxID=1455 RepID=UPI0007B03D8C|nr:5-oxoprolinase subunit PxpB [Bacillus badius]KZN99301.1 kinase inhibitor [Bacillus badius]KZR58554.1 kinase inhibitor [Bacillus badius]OCS84467.1 kinase inhibitor [Bacillus badius]OVE46880.1 kinase inhibitor [Bacillus badius]TDV98807.1 inhibitor of KinA [Bacillus badius]
MSHSFTEIDIKPLGDSALIVQLGEGITPSIHQKVRALSTILEAQPFKGFIESVPAFHNITVYYDPVAVQQNQSKYGERTDRLLTSFEAVCQEINKLLEQVDEREEAEARLIEIPVLYGGEYGPDLEAVAAFHHVSAEEVIQIHTQNECLVYMIGFAPGFPFMGGMDERIATPRRENPRLAIAPGSVGIAGKQTGVYPLETPGGWQIIGRTPLELFRPDSFPPTLLQAGDRVRFVSMSSEEYKAYKERKR